MGLFSAVAIETAKAEATEAPTEPWRIKKGATTFHKGHRIWNGQRMVMGRCVGKMGGGMLDGYIFFLLEIVVEHWDVTTDDQCKADRDETGV